MSARDTTVPQILLIEDAAFQAEVTLLALAQAKPPPDVQWFATAEDAIDFLTMQGAHAQRAPGLPLLVLSDVHLPKLGGLDFLIRIRAVPQLCGLPVVMMSAAASAEEVALCYRHGATGYIDKLTDFADFRRKLLSTVVFWLHVNRFPHDWRTRGYGQ